MLHKPEIYVSRITNLSDARYCAGMDVDMLGFVVDPGHPDYVNPGKYQEMAGWVAGPKRVAEIIASDAIDLSEIIEQYKPDLFHISIDLMKKYHTFDAPLILEISSAELPSFLPNLPNLQITVKYLLITPLPSNGWKFNKTTSDISILLAVGAEVVSIADLLRQTGADGFALQGSRELVPGLKDYDHLSRILEELDG